MFLLRLVYFITVYQCYDSPEKLWVNLFVCIIKVSRISNKNKPSSEHCHQLYLWLGIKTVLVMPNGRDHKVFCHLELKKVLVSHSVVQHKMCQIFYLPFKCSSKVNAFRFDESVISVEGSHEGTELEKVRILWRLAPLFATSEGIPQFVWEFIKILTGKPHHTTKFFPRTLITLTQAHPLHMCWIHKTESTTLSRTWIQQRLSKYACIKAGKAHGKRKKKEHTSACLHVGDTPQPRGAVLMAEWSPWWKTCVLAGRRDFLRLLC